jgi:hypothetical protein
MAEFRDANVWLQWASLAGKVVSYGTCTKYLLLTNKSSPHCILKKWRNCKGSVFQKSKQVQTNLEVCLLLRPRARLDYLNRLPQ